MAAVAYPGLVGPRAHPRPEWRETGPRPPLRAPGPGRAAAPSRASAATYRRRRLGALALALASFPVAHLGATLLGGGPLTAPEEPIRPVAAHVYVVQPGDTVWSIARRLQPTGDPRPLVQTITAELGGSDLQPGQALQVPVP